jgi:uncharacterized protein Yka (UPF0111/DUF47 family)
MHFVIFSYYTYSHYEILFEQREVDNLDNIDDEIDDIKSSLMEEYFGDETDEDFDDFFHYNYIIISTDNL